MPKVKSYGRILFSADHQDAGPYYLGNTFEYWVTRFGNRDSAVPGSHAQRKAFDMADAAFETIRMYVEPDADWDVFRQATKIASDAARSLYKGGGGGASYQAAVMRKAAPSLKKLTNESTDGTMDGLSCITESIRKEAGIEEASKAKGKKAPASAKFKAGDHVAITLKGLQAHSRSIPASMGYSNNTINWRKQLSDRKDQPAIVRSVSLNNVDIEYPDGYYVLVYDYMLKKIKNANPMESTDYSAAQQLLRGEGLTEGESDMKVVKLTDEEAKALRFLVLVSAFTSYPIKGQIKPALAKKLQAKGLIGMGTNMAGETTAILRPSGIVSLEAHDPSMGEYIGRAKRAMKMAESTDTLSNLIEGLRQEAGLTEAKDTTTGKTVLNLYSVHPPPEIGMDAGWYPGTREEMNVRKFRAQRTLEHLDASHPLIKKVTKGKAYGVGWGNSLGLWTISSATEKALIKANDEVSRKRQGLGNGGELPKRHQVQSGGRKTPGVNVPCPKCGTYCYGDCEA